MKAIMVMYDSLNRHFLQPYGSDLCETPNFKRLAEKSVTFDNSWVGSMPCMPARRELHTGRYNFLHRSWGPLEPFDDSMPEILKNAGVHTHLVSDHYHYWEDGGATYHQRYSTWENVRGQEGDNWKALVGYNKFPKKYLNVCGNPEDKWVEQDFINREFMKSSSAQPIFNTFKNGIEFIDNNYNADNWFIQIETFDPHEPFFCQDEYLKDYKPTYNGPLIDWPDYRPLNELDTPELVEHVKEQYKGVLKMCDDNLGKVLDAMDKYNLWKDTMLIVNTDHGFLLGEHSQWAKCHCPFYAEVAHTPLFIWDPRTNIKNVHNNTLVQTIDLPATLLEYFNQPIPENMQGKPLKETILNNKKIHDGIIFGLFAGQVGCTDGNWVYMQSPNATNTPRYEYTLMPTRHGGRRAFINNDILQTAQLVEPLSFTKNIPVLKLEHKSNVSQAKYPSLLFNLCHDPKQINPICDKDQETKMKKLLVKVMKESNSPVEQFERLDLTDF